MCKSWQDAFYILSFLLSHSICISASSSLPVIPGSTHKGWSCLMRAQVSVNSICVPLHVKWMEEVISVSQRLLAWCSDHKKDFSARTGWKKTLYYLNDYFGVFCWGAVTVLEQPSQASWWWGLCYKTCRTSCHFILYDISTELATQGQEWGPAPESAEEKL